MSSSSGISPTGPAFSSSALPRSKLHEAQHQGIKRRKSPESGSPSPSNKFKKLKGDDEAYLQATAAVSAAALSASSSSPSPSHLLSMPQLSARQCLAKFETQFAEQLPQTGS